MCKSECLDHSLRHQSRLYHQARAPLHPQYPQLELRLVLLSLDSLSCFHQHWPVRHRTTPHLSTSCPLELSVSLRPYLQSAPPQDTLSSVKLATLRQQVFSCHLAPVVILSRYLHLEQLLATLLLLVPKQLIFREPACYQQELLPIPLLFLRAEQLQVMSWSVKSKGSHQELSFCLRMLLAILPQSPPKELLLVMSPLVSLKHPLFRPSVHYLRVLLGTLRPYLLLVIHLVM
jgi:hypothetical protein